MGNDLSDLQKKEINVSTVLNEFVYMDIQKEEFSGNESSYVKLKDIVNSIADDDQMEKIQIIKEAIEANSSIGEFELISQSSVDTEIPMTELIACTFKDPSTGDVYFAYRGTGDGKWIDNGDAFTKESSLMQRRAQEYFDLVVENKGLENIDADIIVTGHSKGGNSAQYITMASEHSDLIDHCYSLDGQGFSKEAIEAFKERYGEGYYEQISKMYSINGENDYVHDLGIPIIPEDHTFFIETTAGEGFVGWHTLEGFFREGTVNWEFTEQGPIGKYAKELSKRMMELPPEDIDDCAISIMSLLENGEEYAYGTGDRKFATPEEFIGFFANGIPLMISEAVTSDEMRAWISSQLKDYVNKIANSKYGGLKIAGGVAALTFVAPFIITKVVPLAIETWACTYIAETLFDLADKIKEIKKEVSDFCRNMGDTISKTFSDFGEYIESKISEFQNWIDELKENLKNIRNGSSYTGDADFSVNIDILNRASYEFKKMASKLDSLSDEVASVKRALSQYSFGFNSITLTVLQNNLNSEKRACKNISKGIEKVVSTYHKTEHRIISNAKV